MKVNEKDYPIYEMENKQCSKLPTSHNLIHNYSHVAGFGITDWFSKALVGSEVAGTVMRAGRAQVT